MLLEMYPPELYGPAPLLLMEFSGPIGIDDELGEDAEFDVPMGPYSVWLPPPGPIEVTGLAALRSRSLGLFSYGVGSCSYDVALDVAE